jgi:xanthine dehydrogenase accessory factor
MIKSELTARADELTASRTPFAVATVVRRQRPSSVRPGDSALVLADGTIEGFVGGECAEASVRLHTLKVLETGEPLLLRIVPGDAEGPAEEGAVTVSNPCLSGGALEIFLEPHVPAPRIVVVGDTPIARALERLAPQVGFDAYMGTEVSHSSDDDAAVVVASHGHDEVAALEAALASAVPYVGLVASPKRGAAVRESLDVDTTRLRTPAGLDIGARTPAEIALSILAEVIASRQEVPAKPAVAIDPVCGMEVVASDASLHLDVDGGRVYFCGAGCRATYAQEHAGAS